MGAGSFLPVHGTRLAAVRHAFDISRSTEPPALRRPSTGYSNSGSLAVLAATRRASSRVMSFAPASPRLVLAIDVGERVPVASRTMKQSWPSLISGWSRRTRAAGSGDRAALPAT